MTSIIDLPHAAIPLTVNVDHPHTMQEPIGRDVVLVSGDWSRCIQWWDATRFATPAFWVELTRQRPRPVTYQIGTTLLEEIALCMLGGYGITERMATASFQRVRAAGLLDGQRITEDAVAEVLSTPFSLPGSQRPVHYRFPRSKAQRLAAIVETLRHADPPDIDEPRRLRDWLITLPGVGPNTASWIVRSMTRTVLVAVIDVHIRRAGIVAGLFDPAWRLPRDYASFESAFVTWARIGGVPTADLDACIWSELSALGPAARSLFGVKHLSDLD